MSENGEHFQKILSYVHAQRRKKLWLGLTEGLLKTLGASLGLFLGMILIDAVFSPDPLARRVMVLALALFTLAGLLWMVLRPALYYIFQKGIFSIETVAGEIGRHYQGINDDLLNTIQLAEMMSGNREGYSFELIRHAIHSLAMRLDSIEWDGLYSRDPVLKAGRWFVSPILIVILALGIFPGPFRNGLKHMLHPGVQFKPTPVSKIMVSPGDRRLVEGDSLWVSAKIQGSYSGPISLVLQEETREAPQSITLQPDSARNYRHLLRQLRTTTKYFFKAKDKVSPVYTLQVEKRPFYRKFQVKLVFPEYTNLPPRFLEENVGDITALKGTKVFWQILASKPLQNAKIQFSSGRRLPLAVQGEKAKGSLVLRKDETYSIRLTDRFGYSNLKPIEYVLQTVEDEYPIVDITRPGKDVDLTEEMKLPLSIEAEDDFGFTRLRIGYRIESNTPWITKKDTAFRFISLPIPEQLEARISVNHLWDLVELNLMPEDVLYYFAEVWDNDEVSGPKRAISKIYSARFPSMVEIMNEVAVQDDQAVDELQDVLEEHKELKERLEEIQREIVQQDRVDWFKKKDLEEIATRQEDLRKSVEEVKKKLDEMVERLESNRMLSVETLKKYQELQKLFQEVMTPEMQEALKQLQQAMEKLNESLLKQALQKMQLSEENLLRNLDRTIELLKRLQVEQKMDQAIQITENLAQRQKMINQQLSALPPEQLPNLIQQEQKIQKDAASLDALMKELDRSLKEDAQFQSPTMDSLLAETQKLQKQLSNTMQNMQMNRMQNASHSGQLSEDQLQQMLSQLQNLKEDFLKSQKQEIMKEFTRASKELLKLSRAQEALMQETKGLPSVSPKIGQIAEHQQQQLNHLTKIAEQLYNLGQKTFYVTPEIGQGLGKSFSGMQQAIEQLEQRNTGQAYYRQSAALSGLNETLMQIQRSMENLQGSASSVGMEEFMRRLEQMAGKQQGLNQQTLQLSLQQGKMTLQQQAAMARLAAEQMALKKSLEELQREFGNRSEITGRLEGIAKEMEKVIEDMKKKQVSPTTINRQRRILSRMLDAQRSLHQRDYSRKRRSTPGKTYFVRSPEEISQKIQEQKARFLEDLIRARKAGFNPDYLELIRRYFQAISKMQQVPNE